MNLSDSSKKSLVCLSLLPLFILLAALYGMLHNQISYTISPEYFTRFKFLQFGIAMDLPARIGAALVGLNATLWVGAVLGVVLAPLGLVIPGLRPYLTGMLRTMAVVLLTTLAIGLSAFLLGQLRYSPDAVYFFIPPSVQSPREFFLAGHMHNFSYIGSFLGLCAGIANILRERSRVRRMRQETN